MMMTLAGKKYTQALLAMRTETWPTAAMAMEFELAVAKQVVGAKSRTMS